MLRVGVQLLSRLGVGVQVLGRLGIGVHTKAIPRPGTGMTLPTQYYIPGSLDKEVLEGWGLTFDQTHISQGDFIDWSPFDSTQGKCSHSELKWKCYNLNGTVEISASVN